MLNKSIKIAKLLRLMFYLKSLDLIIHLPIPEISSSHFNNQNIIAL